MNFCSQCGAQVAPDATFCGSCGKRIREAATSSTDPSGSHVASAEMVGRTCPYCRSPLKEGAPIEGCAYCHTVHHADCWRENSGCSVGGCAGAPTQATQAFASQPPGPPPPPGGGFAPPPPPPGEDGGFARRPVALIVALVVALALMGGVAAALIASSGGPAKRVAYTSSPETTATTSTEPTTSTEQSTSTPAETTATTPETTATTTETTSTTPTPPSETPAAEAVTQHWKKLEEHDYRGAWEDETASLGGEEAHWVHGQEEAGIEKISYRFTGGDTSGSHATVHVAQLRTEDKQTGCHTWTGTYGLVHENGRWLIDSVSLARHEC